MSDSEFKQVVITLLEAEGLKSYIDQAKFLSISPQKYKEFFIDDLQKKLSPTLTKRSIEGLVESYRKKIPNKLSQIHEKK
ncbi:hypothetical protein K7I13_02915 [Brucepastera parasyntrophica]|uniref:hypothetical protein n=1 Tax=Brucepastera parasyntrophica TaxID=2880008 RepID=UPI00210BBF4E|nr:hypothetical protein [Brucepastera parasyntrophica]ULQ60280.1 hypothetical protein K7I13_02915 [Brucepastera parasyntrophica]